MCVCGVLECVVQIILQFTTKQEGVIPVQLDKQQSACLLFGRYSTGVRVGIGRYIPQVSQWVLESNSSSLGQSLYIIVVTLLL